MEGWCGGREGKNMKKNSTVASLWRENVIRYWSQCKPWGEVIGKKIVCNPGPWEIEKLSEEGKVRKGIEK